MGRIENIIETFEKCSDFARLGYDLKHNSAAAWAAVTNSNGQLKEEKAIALFLDNHRAFLGCGGDSSVMRCTIDFDKLKVTHREEMLADFLVHEWYREHPEGSFASYSRIIKQKDREVAAKSRGEIKSELVSRIRQLGFQSDEGNRFKGVAAVSLRKVGKNEIGGRRQKRQEFLYGLNHPNILSVVFGFLSNNHLVQIEEWGGNRRWASLSLGERVKIVMDVATGVDYLHTTYGVIHRDIKPSNVLITGDSPRGKLADFSIVKMQDLQAKGIHTITESGHSIGTPQFSAPEQCAGSPSHRSDIYGLGALLYAYLTQKNPADQSSGLKKSQDPLLIVNEDTTLARRLRLIVAGCMQPNQSNRYSTAKQVYEDLEAALYGREPQKVLEVVSGLNYSLRNVNTYVASVFDEHDHEVEPAITAELVTQPKPSELQGRSRKRSFAKGSGLVLFAALSLGTIAVLTNPHGIGDKIVAGWTQVRSKLEEVYDSAKTAIDAMRGR